MTEQDSTSPFQQPSQSQQPPQSQGGLEGLDPNVGGLLSYLLFG
jgi:hypothetical protein